MASPTASDPDLYRESFKYFKGFGGSRIQKSNNFASKSCQCDCVNTLKSKELDTCETAIDDHCNNEEDEKDQTFPGDHHYRCGCKQSDVIDKLVLPHPPGNNNLELKSNTPDSDSSKKSVIIRTLNYNIESQCQCYRMWGLRPPETWQVYELTFPEGLIVIRNPFTVAGQRYWIQRSLLDFPHHLDYITNMDNLNRLQKIKNGEQVKNLQDFKLDTCSKDFYQKLRWVTFGYHHDWDTKIYSEEMRSNFPEDLADMTRYFSQLLGFSDFEAEAAIANYYHMDSTLSGHVDRSEVNQSAPLFSLSFGQSAIFLIGGKTKTERPQPVLLQSGDVAVMSGESRLSYHGVPKILPANCDAWSVEPPSTFSTQTGNRFSSKRQKLDSSVTKDSIKSFIHTCESFKETVKDFDVLNKVKASSWTDFHETYISKSRINLNIRQVLFSGQLNLSS